MRFQVGDRVRHTKQAGWYGTIIDLHEPTEEHPWDLVVDWEPNEATAHTMLLSGRTVIPTYSGNVVLDDGLSDVDTDRLPDEPTADEFDEALEPQTLDVSEIDLTLVYLDPRRVLALREATATWYGQIGAGYAMAPDQAHILAIARFLLDEEFVVGVVK